MRQVRIHDVEHITIPMEKPVYLVVTIMGMGMGIGLGMCIGMGMGSWGDPNLDLLGRHWDQKPSSAIPGWSNPLET